VFYHGWSFFKEEEMRLRKARLFTVAALCLFVHLGLAGCSTSQEEQGDPEVSVEETTQDGGEAAAVEGNTDVGDPAAAAASDTTEMPENTPVENTVSDAAVANNATTTDSEMQDIINSGAAQNAAPVADAAPPADMAAPLEATPAEVAPVADAAPPANAVAAIPAPETAAPVAAPAAIGGGVNVPEMGSKMPYVVQPGDTLARIATKVYGDAAKWKQIASLTNITNPNRIYPGDVVYYQLAPETVAFANSYESAPRNEVKAEAGDTLFKISSKVLGSPIHWRSIWRENGHIDTPDTIEPGTTIYFVDHAGLKSAMNQVKSVNTVKTKSVEKPLAFSGAVMALFGSMS
jgi:nucleoid-associated protein YgaU